VYTLGWLPIKVDLGGWLGEVFSLGQDELTGFGNTQDVLPPFMQQDDLALPLH
jgi:hypothetical protein